MLKIGYGGPFGWSWGVSNLTILFIVAPMLHSWFDNDIIVRNIGTFETRGKFNIVTIK